MKGRMKILIGSEARIVNACWRIPTTTSEPLLGQIAGQIAGWIAEEHARVKSVIRSSPTWWGASHMPQRPLRDRSAQSPLQFAFGSAITFNRS